MERNRSVSAEYLDYSGRDDVSSGGVKMIPVETAKGTFRAWTKRVGDHPTMKVLLLHGGPGATREYFEACDSYFPAAGIEYYYYDQLGPAYSDQPDAPELWERPASSGKLSKSGKHSGSTRRTSTSSVTRGAGFWPWSTS